jgi:ankyrin repeat protein
MRHDGRHKGSKIVRFNRMHLPPTWQPVWSPVWQAQPAVVAPAALLPRLPAARPVGVLQAQPPAVSRGDGVRPLAPAGRQVAFKLDAVGAEGSHTLDVRGARIMVVRGNTVNHTYYNDGSQPECGEGAGSSGSKLGQPRNKKKSGRPGTRLWQARVSDAMSSAESALRQKVLLGDKDEARLVQAWTSKIEGFDGPQSAVLTVIALCRQYGLEEEEARLRSALVASGAGAVSASRTRWANTASTAEPKTMQCEFTTEQKERVTDRNAQLLLQEIEEEERKAAEKKKSKKKMKDKEDSRDADAGARDAAGAMEKNAGATERSSEAKTKNTKQNKKNMSPRPAASGGVLEQEEEADTSMKQDLSCLSVHIEFREGRSKVLKHEHYHSVFKLGDVSEMRRQEARVQAALHALLWSKEQTMELEETSAESQQRKIHELQVQVASLEEQLALLSCSSEKLQAPEAGHKLCIKPSNSEASEANESLTAGVFSPTFTHKLEPEAVCILEFQELFEAVQTSDAKRVEGLLNRGVPLDTRDADKDTPLHKAAFWGQRDIAEMLIGRGAPMELLNKDNDSPLTMAVAGGEKEVVALLLTHNANVLHRNKWNSTPLHKAAWKGHRDCALLLIEHKAEVNAINDAHDAPLHRACENGHKEVADLLLGHAALVHAHNKVGATPLHFAARWGHKDVASLLLKHDASVHARADGNDTPMHAAAASTAKGSTDVVSVLAAHGASICALNSKSESSLHSAVCSGRTETVSLLITLGAPLNGLNADGKSALDVGKEQCKCEAIELLEAAASAALPRPPVRLEYDIGDGASLVLGRKMLLSPTASFDHGNPLPYFAAELPAGLCIDKYTGVIAGVPTAEFKLRVTVTASNEHGAVTTAFQIQARDIKAQVLA